MESGDFAVKTLAPRHFVGIRRRVEPAQIGVTCAEVLPRVAGWLAARGVAPVGAPMTVYHSMDRATGVFDLQPGFFVAAPLDGEGDISCDVTAGGPAVTAVHVGPYDTIGDTWHALFGWVEARGHDVVCAAWEVYVTDPGRCPPADNRTEIIVPFQER